MRAVTAVINFQSSAAKQCVQLTTVVKIRSQSFHCSSTAIPLQIFPVSFFTDSLEFHQVTNIMSQIKVFSYLFALDEDKYDHSWVPWGFKNMQGDNSESRLLVKNSAWQVQIWPFAKNSTKTLKSLRPRILTKEILVKIQCMQSFGRVKVTVVCNWDETLVNKPYLNEVTLTGQNLCLKCL